MNCPSVVARKNLLFNLSISKSVSFSLLLNLAVALCLILVPEKKEDVPPQPVEVSIVEIVAPRPAPKGSGRGRRPSKGASAAKKPSLRGLLPGIRYSITEEQAQQIDRDQPNFNMG